MLLPPSLQHLRPGLAGLASILVFTAITATGNAAAQQPLVSIPSVLPGAATSSVATPPISAAHHEAIANMLKALHLDDMIMTSINHKAAEERPKTPQAAASLGAMLQALDTDQLLAGLLPVFAAAYTQADAEAITQMLQTSIGTKFVAAIITAASTGGAFHLDPANLSSEERQTLTDFMQAPAGQKFMQLSAILRGPDAEAVVRTWVMSGVRKKIRDTAALARKQANVADLAAIADGASEPAANAARPGLDPDAEARFIEAVTAIRMDAASQTAQAFRLYRSEIERLSQADFLSVATLTSANAIAASKDKLVLMNQALEHIGQTYSAVLKQIRQRYAALVLPEDVHAKFMQGVDEQLARAYDQQIRYAENQRAQFALYQRLFDFVQQRLDKISEVDRKLTFVDNADRENFQAIVAQIGLQRRREAELIAQAKLSSLP